LLRDTSSLAPEIAPSAVCYGEPNEPLALCKSPDCLSGQSVRLSCRSMSLALVKTEGNKLWDGLANKPVLLLQVHPRRCTFACLFTSAQVCRMLVEHGPQRRRVPGYV